MTNQYELPIVPSASSGIGNDQIINPVPSGLTQPYSGGNDTTNLASRLESVEKYVQDLYANYAKLGANANFLNLTVSEKLTANWGTIGGFDVASGVISTPNLILDSNNQRILLGITNGIILDGVAKVIQSSNYQTGVSGFKISPDLVEAENIIARGTLRGSTFAYDHVSAIGGQLMIANADTLASDMTALDSSTLTIKGDTTFVANDMLVMRGIASSGVQEEWMRVTSAASAPTYTVTRDLVGSFSANANPAWKAGTPVVKQGKSDGASTYSGGWLRLIGEGTNAPYYSVFARTGVAYNSYAEAVRLGNLNGIGGVVTDKYGIYIGDSSGYLTYNSTNGLVLSGNITIGTSNYIKGGQTDYNTGTGFFLGYSSGNYKFSIGDGVNHVLSWDGTTLTIKGDAPLKQFTGYYNDSLSVVANNSTVTRKIMNTTCYNATSGNWGIYSNVLGYKAYGASPVPYDWDDNYDMTCRLSTQVGTYFSGVSQGSATGWGLNNNANLVTSSSLPGGTAPTSFTFRHIMFINDRDGNLYASCANGTTQTTSAISGVTVTNENNYRIVYTTNSSALFYVNDVLKATLTTNLPTGATDPVDIMFWGAVSYNSSNKINTLLFNNYKITVY